MARQYGLSCPASGLYDPRREHDACGIGAVVNICGRRTHAIVEQGKQILLNLMHRGAAGADESTGDGAGMLLQVPDEFFRAETQRDGITLPPAGQYGVAMLFLPHDAGLRSRCEGILAQGAQEEGLGVLGWRDVPTDNSSLGEIARGSEPVVRQALFDGRGQEGEELERRLYVVRKRVERRVRERLGQAAEAFYVPSMSSRTIVYKGMFLAPQLFDYYPDLSDEAVVTALTIVHQRYSTNTFPSWRLAQRSRTTARSTRSRATATGSGPRKKRWSPKR